MEYKFNNGWYEILHNRPHETTKQIPWRPCEEWCEETFGVDRTTWYMRHVVYEHYEHPTDRSKNTIETKTPLTWMFRNEEDALLFILRWS